MHFSTLILPLAFTLSVASEPLNPSKSLPAGHVYARKMLQARLDVPISLACGSNAVDCKNGWCCESSMTCGGVFEGIPLCKAPDVTAGPLGPGSAVATPFKNVDGVLSSFGDQLDSQLAEITGTGRGAFISSIVSSELAEATGTTTTGGGRVSSAIAEATASGTGNSAAALGAPNGFGNTVVMTMAMWGAAALGGMGWLMI